MDRFHLHRPGASLLIRRLVCHSCVLAVFSFLPVLHTFTKVQSAQTLYSPGPLQQVMSQPSAAFPQALNKLNLNCLDHRRQFGQVRRTVQSPKQALSLPINTGSSRRPDFTGHLVFTTKHFTPTFRYYLCSFLFVVFATRSSKKRQLPLVIPIRLFVRNKVSNGNQTQVLPSCTLLS